MSLPSSMADFVPCDRLLQKAYYLLSFHVFLLIFLSHVSFLGKGICLLFIRLSRDSYEFQINACFHRGVACPISYDGDRQVSSYTPDCKTLSDEKSKTWAIRLYGIRGETEEACASIVMKIQDRFFWYKNDHRQQWCRNNMKLLIPS